MFQSFVKYTVFFNLPFRPAVVVAIVRAVVWELPTYIKRKLLLESFFIEYLNFTVPSGKHEFLVRLGSLLLLLVLLIYVLLLLVHLCHLHPGRMGRVGKFSVSLVLANTAQPVCQIFRFKNSFMGSGRVSLPFDPVLRPPPRLLPRRSGAVTLAPVALRTHLSISHKAI